MKKLQLSLLTTTCISSMSASAAEVNVESLSVSAEYVHETTAVLDGGINQRSDWRELFVLDVEWDLEKAMGLAGATLVAQFQHSTSESGGTIDSGDFQAYSNIEVERSIDELYELWLQKEWLDGKLRVKVGKVDANTEFNYVDSAGAFANSSAGFSPTIFTFPSYPNSAMSVNVFWQVNKSITWSYGFYDGANAVDGVETGRFGPSTFFSDDQSDDYFHVLQVEKTWNSLGRFGSARASAGLWHHTGEFAKFTGGIESGTTGAFLTFEQQLSGNTEEQGYFGFAQYGWADSDVSESEHHIATGFVARSIGITRDGDEAGIYITHVDLSDKPGAGFEKNETAIDLYYNFSVTDYFSVQPEIQYIINPAGSSTTNDAFVAGVRAALSF